MNHLNLLLVGLGNMGKIHKRIIESNNNTNLFGVVDVSFQKKYEIKKGVKYYNNLNLVDFENEHIDGVIIASTTNSHYKIGKNILDLKLPLFIEKPVSINKKELNSLLNNAKRQNLVFRGGLIEIYNPIFQYIKELKLKDIISIHIFRHSQSVKNSRNLENVLFDLALHDISILGYLFNNPKLKLKGSNYSFNRKSMETADLMFKYNKSNIFISTSRESQLKIRKWNIQTKNKLYHIDLIQKNIDIYDSGSIKYPDANLLSLKSNHSTLSFANQTETAQIQLNEFIENIRKNKVDGKHLDLVKYSHNIVSDINN